VTKKNTKYLRPKYKSKAGNIYGAGLLLLVTLWTQQAKHDRLLLVVLLVVVLLVVLLLVFVLLQPRLGVCPHRHLGSV
jgi:hypothetical protein